MADYRNSSGIVLEDGPSGPLVTLEDSSRVDPWIVGQAQREAAACQRGAGRVRAPGPPRHRRLSAPAPSARDPAPCRDPSRDPAGDRLYAPVKALLEGQGYSVKGEINGCDVVGVRGDEPPVIVELKKTFGLALVLQGIDRLAMTDAVYLAVGAWPTRQPETRRLCRRLGLGLIVVTHGRAEVVLDPVPYRPRKDGAGRAPCSASTAGASATRREGGATRRPIMTAYRQEAMRCAALLAGGPMRVAGHAGGRGRAERGPDRPGQRLRLVRAGRARRVRADAAWGRWARIPGGRHAAGRSVLEHPRVRDQARRVHQAGLAGHVLVAVHRP